MAIWKTHPTLNVFNFAELAIIQCSVFNFFYFRMADGEIDQNVQVFKIKRLIRNLEKARGNGTSMISLIIPPKEQIAKQQKVFVKNNKTSSNDFLDVG